MHNKPWAGVLPERKLTAPNVKKKNRPVMNCKGCIKKWSWHISRNWFGICQAVVDFKAPDVRAITSQDASRLKNCSERPPVADDCKRSLTYLVFKLVEALHYNPTGCRFDS
jgi:hypothetical protein